MFRVSEGRQKKSNPEPGTFKRNIAEEFDSDTNPEFVRFLKDAKRSRTEVSLVSG